MGLFVSFIGPTPDVPKQELTLLTGNRVKGKVLLLRMGNLQSIQKIIQFRFWSQVHLDLTPSQICHELSFDDLEK